MRKVIFFSFFTVGDTRPSGWLLWLVCWSGGIAVCQCVELLCLFTVCLFILRCVPYCSTAPGQPPATVCVALLALFILRRMALWILSPSRPSRLCIYPQCLMAVRLPPRAYIGKRAVCAPLPLAKCYFLGWPRFTFIVEIFILFHRRVPLAKIHVLFHP